MASAVLRRMDAVLAVAAVAAVAFQAVLVLTPALPDREQPRLSAVRVTAPGCTLSVEAARTDEQRERGLMFRRSLGAREGMLFDFGGDGRQSMWMVNTRVAP